RPRQVKAIKECKEEVIALCKEHHCNPILVRLAWHDAGTFDKDCKKGFPKRGGATASIRFEPEINHAANAGLVNALHLLQPIKDKHPEVGWADLIQLASAAAIEEAGGPVIDMKYGRKDAESSGGCVDEGNLPAGSAPFPKADTPQARSCLDHIRNVFYRMGFDDEAIVALSGAHTLGRAQKGRSGEGAEMTKLTSEGGCPRGAGKSGVGMPGGSAWTENWLQFDNSYFKTIPDKDADPEILKMETDKCLFTDEGFLPHAQKFKDSQEAFFESYKKAHKKLSELGCEWEPEGGFTV
ncbi:unnamed protein product, partial [Ascophyllum nodosum]